MKKQLLAIAGVIAIAIVLSGCSILSGILGPGAPDPRCAVIEKTLLDGIGSGEIEVIDIAKVDLPGSAALPTATCSFSYTSDTDAEGGFAYFNLYLTKDDSRIDTIGASLTDADFTHSASGDYNYWFSPADDDGKSVAVSRTAVEDFNMEGPEAFTEALGTEGEIFLVVYPAEAP